MVTSSTNFHLQNRVVMSLLIISVVFKMAEQCRKRRACKLYSREEVLGELLSDSSDYDDSDADPDYCLPKRSKDQGSDDIEFQQLRVYHASSTTGAMGEPSTIGATGKPSTTAGMGEPSSTGATGEPSSTGATGEPSTIGAMGEPSTIGATGEPSTTGATGEPSTTGATGKPSTTAGMGEPSSTGATGEPSSTGATGEPSTIGAMGEPSTIGATGEPSTTGATGEPSTTGATGEPSTIGAMGEPSTISAALGLPSTSAAAGGSSTSTATKRPSTSVTSCAPSTLEPTGRPSTTLDAPLISEATGGPLNSAARETSAQTTEEKRQYSNTRKRQRNPDKWKKNIRKEEYNHGLEHVNTAGKKVTKRSPKAADCAKCRFKCTLNFDDNSRQRICNTYWSLDYNRKKDFILSNLKSEDVKRERARGERKRAKTKANKFYLRNETEVKMRVCKDFFLKTLCISHGPVLSALKNQNEHGIFQGGDRRGKHVPHNKTKEEHIEAIKSHIKSLPTMESHYTRASSKRLYLDPKLTIKKMYELFCEEFSVKNPEVTQPSQHIYREVFCNDFNLSFFVPKKDQCMTCTKYANLTGDAKVAFQEDHEEHLRRKTLSHLKKDEDKTRANNDHSFMSVTFDLQSVLVQIPSCQASLTYYMRKLCVYNLTVYEQRKPSNAYCFTWQETEGKRGAVEIGTCIYEYLKTLPNTVKEVSLWSDTCSGQNRNQYIAIMFLSALRSLPHLSKITHNYLESGHSSMEADSMHSSIETEKKNRIVFSMIDWISVFKNARRGHPYIVKQFKHREFLNFQWLAKSVMKNRTKATNGSKVNWLKVKRFQYRQEDLSSIFYSYDYNGDFETLDTRGARRRSSAEKETTWELISAYQKRLPISKEKKADLLKLCKEMVIPDELHGWFNDLPTSQQAIDGVPEPAASDSEDDDE